MLNGKGPGRIKVEADFV